jgi:DNA modification methylase
MFSKSKDYFYDYEAIKTPPAGSSIKRWAQNIEAQEGSNRVPGKTNGTMKAVGGPKKTDKQRGHDRWDKMTVEEQQSMGANKRSVWTIATAGYSGDHYATFPEDLIVDPIKAGCPPHGIVLDPFMGRGTTGLVAAKNSRYFLGLELNPYDIGKAEDRLYKEGGIFALPIAI